MPHIVKAAFSWTLICGAAAAPSFVLGSNVKDSFWGMLLGIATFIVAYTALSCTAFARNLYSRRIWRRTIQIGYGTRIGLSILGLFAFVGVPLTLFADIMLGIVAVHGAKFVVGVEAGFAFAYIATILEGAMMNAVLAIYMLIVYSICRLVMQPEVEKLRGFEVIPMAQIAKTDAPPFVRNDPASPPVSP